MKYHIPAAALSLMPYRPMGIIGLMSDARLMGLGSQYLIIGGHETLFLKTYFALFGLLFFDNPSNDNNIGFCSPHSATSLCEVLSGRAFGIVLSIFAIIEVIALLSYQISVSTSRLMMTELPTALLLLIFTFLLFKWYKNNNSVLSTFYSD